MEKRKSHFFLKILPVIIYSVLEVADLCVKNPTLETLLLTPIYIVGSILLFFGHGLIMFEIFLFANAKYKKTIGIIAIIVSIICGFLSYALHNLAFSFAGYWTLPIMLQVLMNGVYCIITIILMIRAR